MPGFNRIKDFAHKLRGKNHYSKYRIGEFCKNKMDYYVPVDTGYLKSRNKYKITKDGLQLLNDASYAGYVEFGTSKMLAQPFIRPSINNHVGEIRAIIRSVYKL